MSRAVNSNSNKLHWCQTTFDIHQYCTLTAKYKRTHFQLTRVPCLQCFDTVGWQEGHPDCKKTEWWGAGMVICLQQDADMAQLMPSHSLFLASVKSRLVLPFWYRLTRVVPDKGPLNGGECIVITVPNK